MSRRQRHRGDELHGRAQLPLPGEITYWHGRQGAGRQLQDASVEDGNEDGSTPTSRRISSFTIATGQAVNTPPTLTGELASNSVIQRRDLCSAARADLFYSDHG